MDACIKILSDTFPSVQHIRLYFGFALKHWKKVVVPEGSAARYVELSVADGSEAEDYHMLRRWIIL